MAAQLRPGLPAEAYNLGAMTGVFRPSVLSSMGSLVVLLACLILSIVGLAVFGNSHFSGTADQFQQALMGVSALFTLLSSVGLSGLFRYSRGSLITLADGFIVLIPDWDRKKAKVYRWGDIRNFCTGNEANLPTAVPKSAAAKPGEPANPKESPLAHGKDHFSIRTTDNRTWIFGSDLSYFPALQRLFEEKAKSQTQ